MTRDRLLVWLTELETRRPTENLGNRNGLSPEAAAWEVEVGSMLESALPPGHFLLREWAKPLPPSIERSTRGPDAHSRFQQVRGFFIAAKRLIEEDRTGTLVDEIRAQTESEVLDTAFALLVDDHRIAAAVLGGGALEVHLRRLYERTPGLTAFRGDPTIAKYDGAFAQARNTNQPVPYGTADSKSVIAWADHRNAAAHTPDRFMATGDQVKLMLEGIRDFLVRTK